MKKYGWLFRQCPARTVSDIEFAATLRTLASGAGFWLFEISVWVLDARCR